MTTQHRIQADFSKAATYYHQHATLQKAVTEKAARRYAPYLNHLKAPQILDIGCGTGFFSQFGAIQHPDWEITQADYAFGMCQKAAELSQPTLCMDMNQLALKDACLDGFFSCLSIQWVTTLAQVFQETHRVLKPNSYACFVTFGQGTLHELSHAFTAHGYAPPVLAFPNHATLIQTFEAASLMLIDAKQETIVEHYPTPYALMRHLKHIGADFKHQHKGLMGKQALKNIQDFYKEHYTKKGGEDVTASFEIYYFIVKKP
jgi:malonyl-CoA O-methyltransferase